ncbi:MAG TPA: hypothetical protein ENK10_09630 [Acidobacteria bacterium]|nr:hypothetical protein [Acidobacteriota bacterium]
MRRTVAGLLVLLLGAAGCAGTRRPPPADPAVAACTDYRLRARWQAPPGERSASARIALRHCPEQGFAFEVRGRVGGPVLAGAAGDGRLRLLFPRQREVIDGPDSQVEWKRWTGLPLSGSLLEGLLRGEQTALPGSWRRVTPSDADLEVVSADGGRLRLWKIRQAPARQGFQWPAAPAGWRRIDSSDLPSAGGSGP